MDSRRRRINDIYKELDKHNKLSHNELKKIIIGKGLMSDRPFEETLKHMWANNTISRVQEEEGRRLVWYSTKPEVAEIENKIAKYYEGKIQDLKHQFTIFKNQFNELSLIEKANGIALFFHLTYVIEHNLKYFDSLIFSKVSKLKKHQKYLHDIKHELFHTMDTKDPAINGKIMTIMRDIFLDVEVKIYDDLFAFLHKVE